MSDEITIVILVGLPGSGKTYYAKANGAVVGDYFIGTYIGTHLSCIDFDHRTYVGKPIKDIFRVRFNAAINEEFCENTAYWIFDGLFLTNEAQHNLISEIQNSNRTDKHFKIQFVYFEENREVCLFNDSHRARKTHADITIKSAKYEKPDIDKLKNEFPEMEFSLIEKDVYKMNTYDCIFKSYEYPEDSGLLKSQEWSLGGTWGDYRGNHGALAPEHQPTAFKEFDELIEKVCPNIAFLQYKKLYNECVTVEEDGHADYYGGYENVAYYQCKLKDLYNMMVEMNLIDNQLQKTD